MSGRRFGSLHRGYGEWLWQRLTAIYMGGFVIYFVVYVLSSPLLLQHYKLWRDWISGGYMRIALALFFASLFIHAWIGLRSVAIDYIKPLAVRFSVLTLIGAGLLALALWVANILLVL